MDIIVHQREIEEGKQPVIEFISPKFLDPENGRVDVSVEMNNDMKRFSVVQILTSNFVISFDSKKIQKEDEGEHLVKVYLKDDYIFNSKIDQKYRDEIVDVKFYVNIKYVTL